MSALLYAWAAALGGEVSGRQVLCPGPGHSPADRSLSVKPDGRGGYVVHSFSGDDFRACRDHVAALIGAPPRDWQAPTGPAPADDGRKRRMALELWREARPIAGTLAETYLTGRGLSGDGISVLRYHPRTPRGADRLPAMLALMSHPVTGAVTGVHRTFLAPSGASHAGKQMLAPAGVVRLSPDEDVTHGLGIAEGIETALSVLARGWGPVWACLTAGGIERLPVLSGVECLTIFADHDDAGLRAAERCAHRWRDAGREVRLLPPPERGQDWAGMEAAE